MKPSNLALAFKKCKQEHRPALLTYTVSGDPNKKKSFEISYRSGVFQKDWLDLRLAFLMFLEHNCRRIFFHINNFYHVDQLKVYLFLFSS